MSGLRNQNSNQGLDNNLSENPIEQYCENKDNSITILEKMAYLYTEKLMTDIVLCVGMKNFPAHRLILCASSKVFEVMLMNPEWNESKEEKISLQEAPECVEVFESFLRYLYTGLITLSHDSVLAILALADKYIVKDLVKMCESYMKEHLVSAARNGHLFSWLQYAVSCGHKEIEHCCMNYLKWNFEKVANSEEFGCCDLSLLTSVLSHHDLVINDEMTLYNYVVMWLHYQEERLSYRPLIATREYSGSDLSSHSKTLSGNLKMSSTYQALSQPSINQFQKKYYLRRESTCSSSDLIDQMEYLTQEVMRFVRFPMMTPRQLADLLLVPLTIKYKEFFVTRMAIGMYYHSGQWSRIHEILEELDPSNELLFTPRLYTADQWGACLTVDHVTTLPSYCKRTLVFSTPASSSEIESNDSQLEWIVDLYPKGVWFQKFYLIVWHGTFELPESVLRTIRLAITAKEADYARVRIAVLVYGIQDGIEHILNVVTRRHIFTAQENLLNLDDVLPYGKLNFMANGQKYLLDPLNSLKIHVVISPLSDPKLGLCKH